MKSFGKELPGKTRKEMEGITFSTMLWLLMAYDSYTHIRKSAL
jgi:hypothetical protein